jgi:rhodanese-related sulfurtransferase
MAPRKISVAEVKRKLDAGAPIFFVDTRNLRDWGSSNVKLPGAHRIHYSQVEQYLGEIPHDRLIVAYCT